MGNCHVDSKVTRAHLIVLFQLYRLCGRLTIFQLRSYKSHFVFSFWFQREKYFKNGLGQFLSFLGKFKSMRKYYIYCSVLLCLWKVLCVTKELGFFCFTPVLNVGNVKYSCSICRVNNRSQLSVCAGKHTSNFMLSCMLVFLWKSSLWFKSHFYC